MSSIGIEDWRWCGSPHHFCAASRCHFGFTTFVGDYVVSTVGEYRPDGPSSDLDTLAIGPDSFYETMVFRGGGEETECGNQGIADLSELDRCLYSTAKEANAGHLAMCQKWATA